MINHLQEEGEEERGGPSLQNEDPTPQDGWEINISQNFENSNKIDFGVSHGIKRANKAFGGTTTEGAPQRGRDHHQFDQEVAAHVDRNARFDQHMLIEQASAIKRGRPMLIEPRGSINMC